MKNWFFENGIVSNKEASTKGFFMKKCDPKWPIYTIKRKKGIVYNAIVSKNGQRQYSKSFNRKIDAIIWLKEQYSLSESNIKNLTKEFRNRSIDWLCNYWLENYCKIYKSPSSIARDIAYFKNQFQPYIGKFKIQELTPLQIENWLAKLKNKLAAKTCNHSLGLLKKIYTDAIRWQFVEYNPALAVKRFKEPQIDLAFWSFDEKSIFLSFILKNKPELFPLFITATMTGMRAGELAGLKWDCIDFTTGQITVKRTYCLKSLQLKETPKSNKIRRIPMNHQVRSELVQHKSCSKSEKIFPEFDFSHPSRNFKKLCKLSGVTEIRFHDLRHTFASHFMMAGGNIYDLQKMLGHSSIQMTERYSHLSPDHLNGATEILTTPVSRNQNIINFPQKK